MDSTYHILKYHSMVKLKYIKDKFFLIVLHFYDDIIIPIIHETTNKLVEELGNL